MAKASISKAWEDTRIILRKETRLLSAVALALIVLPSTVIGALSPDTLTGTGTADLGTTLAIFLILVLGIIGRITFARIALGSSDTLGGVMKLALQRSVNALLAFALFGLPFALLFAPLILRVQESSTPLPPDVSVPILVLIIAAFALGVRFLLMVIPASAVERLGPIALLKRSWTLTRGHWWRLIAFVLLIFIASSIAGWVVRAVLGGVLLLAGGAIEPLTVGALVLAAALAIVSALFAVVFALMIARIYAQLAGDQQPEVSVPSSGA